MNRRRPGVRLRSLWLAGWLGAWAAPLHAQAADSARAARHPPTELRWYHVAAAAAGTSLLMLVDQPVQTHVQDHRSATSDHVASVFRHVGQPEVWGTVSVGLVVAGLAAHDDALARVGGRAVASVGLAGASTLAVKGVLGRTRPDAGEGWLDFDPFGRSEGLPSGHSALAFALATSLADDIHRPWATVGLYAIATGTAFSRLNDNRHWLSDVGLGAVVGITSAKLASGRWQVFHIRPPGFLATPTGGLGVGWRATL